MRVTKIILKTLHLWMTLSSRGSRLPRALYVFCIVPFNFNCRVLRGCPNENRRGLHRSSENAPPSALRSLRAPRKIESHH